jgi:hypothetical protein
MWEKERQELEGGERQERVRERRQELEAVIVDDEAKVRMN